MYTKNAAYPPTIFARVVNKLSGEGITSGVTTYHIQDDSTRTATTNSAVHVSGGLWRLTPVQAESDYNEFAIEFYHADAVGGGPVVSIVTTTHVAQSGDTFAELPARFSNLYIEDSVLGGVNVAHINGNSVTHSSSGYLKTDAVRISGSQTAANNVEANIGHLDASIAGLNDPSAAAIADAVWDESTTGHVDAGTFGQQVKTDIDAILADTSELQSNQNNWTTATGFSTHSAVDVWSVNTRVLTASTNLNDPSAAAIADAVWDEARNDHAAAGSFGETMGTLEANIDYLDASIAGLNDVSTAQVNAEVDAALADAGVTAVRMAYVDNLNGHAAQSGDVYAALPDNFTDLAITATSGRIDVGAWLGTAVTTSGTSAKPEVDMASIHDDAAAASGLEAMLNASPTGTVNDAAPTTTSFVTDLAEASDDHYNGAFLLFTSGALTGQAREMDDYNGTSKTITVATAFTENPADGDAFVILGRATS